MEQALALAAVALLGNKVIEFLKRLTSKDWNGALTQVIAWAVGWGVIALAAAASVTESLVIPGTSVAIGSLDGASLLFLGLVASSTGSVIYDFKKSFDSTDSAVQPPLNV